MTRSRSITFLAGAAGGTLAALALAGCGAAAAAQTRSGSPEDRQRTAGHGRRRERSNLGKILVDSQGRTLYLFQKDSGTTERVHRRLRQRWPPLRATGKPTVGSGANASIVATTTRSDGKPQVTYNGHPLYLYSGDQKPGDTNGQGLTHSAAAGSRSLRSEARSPDRGRAQGATTSVNRMRTSGSPRPRISARARRIRPGSGP